MSDASQTTELDKVQDEDFDQFMIFMVTFMRAREHAQVDRLFSDVFAEPLTRQVAPQLAPRVLKWMEKTPRPENFVAIRTRYLDDSISQRNPRIRQVVLFRSGLDARAYRLEALRGCRVFEIDRNAELFAHKKTILDGLNAPLIAERRDCIVVDIKEGKWEEKLFASGFDASSPTFWALEGVLMYSSQAGNAALLKTIDLLSTAGSEIWGDLGGSALVREDELNTMKHVNALSQAERGKQLFQYAEDDALHGVLSQLAWQLELQAALLEGGTHFGRVFDPIRSGTGAPVQFSFVHGTKPAAAS